MLGQVPNWMKDLAEPVSEHSWGLFRDLNPGKDTELSGREKALIGVGAVAATNRPYCTYLRTEEARLSDIVGEEFREVANLIVEAKYPSTVLHEDEIDLGGFKAETDEVVEYITKQQAPADD